MNKLKEALKSRLEKLDSIAKQGVIPGELDSYELEQLIGRIKELIFVQQLIAAGEYANEANEILEKDLPEL